MSVATPPPPVDLPAVPRPRPSRIVLVVGALVGVAGAAIVGLSLLGRDGSYATREHVPSSVRASPGGYRAFHFWHSGYSGGK